MIAFPRGNFDEVRSAVRDQPYANAKAERDAIKHVDQLVFDEVRSHERELVREWQWAVTDLTTTIQTAEHLADKLQNEITGPFVNASWTEKPVDIGGAVARYNVFFQQVQDALAQLAKKESDMSWRAEKLRDPYNDLANLRNKFFSGNQRFETRQSWVDGQGLNRAGSVDVTTAVAPIASRTPGPSPTL
ncbi:hypothetical protein [Rathayibacter agropyri]|uniref:hypothetical protein n=1 Tax=Rathayibacter agropyri TaxID=1634927 RepID=UPI0015670F07|nr:hypothetical protein [Rathayibacter agropyri]NRD08410.1 hypothetical protein [Rathayibacter agropyri]